MKQGDDVEARRAAASVAVVAEDFEAEGFMTWVGDSRSPKGLFECSDGRWVHCWPPSPRFILAAGEGDEINSNRSENRPFITADGKFLFFNSNVNGSRDVFWVDLDVVKKLKPA